MIAKGKDASDLFPAVVKNVVSKNMEVENSLKFLKLKFKSFVLKGQKASLCFSNALRGRTTGLGITEYKYLSARLKRSKSSDTS